MWLASSQGVYTLNPNTLSLNKFSVRDGLADNMAYSIVIDKGGDPWIGTLTGISHMVTRGGRVEKVIGYTGLNDRGYQSGFMSADGKIHFAGVKGVTTFDPTAVAQTQLVSAPSVRRVTVSSKRVNLASIIGGRNVLETQPDSVLKINLPFNENAMTLRLSTMDFRDSHNVAYHWRLADMDKSWVSTGEGENSISISHLQPGKHTLEIQASDNQPAYECPEIHQGG